MYGKTSDEGFLTNMDLFIVLELILKEQARAFNLWIVKYLYERQMYCCKTQHVKLAMDDN
jgi:hypothetical protein